MSVAGQVALDVSPHSKVHADRTGDLSYHERCPAQATVTGTVDVPARPSPSTPSRRRSHRRRFTLALPIAEGPNIDHRDGDVARAARVGTASLTVTLDTTPPHVTITSPPDQFVTTDASRSRSPASSTTSSSARSTTSRRRSPSTALPAQVANRTFLADERAADAGPNVIQAVGTRSRRQRSDDADHGHARARDTERRFRRSRGTTRAGAIGVAAAVPAGRRADRRGRQSGAEHAGHLQGDAERRLAGAAGATAQPTRGRDDRRAGRRSAHWTLGHRAGAGGNAVEAYAVGFDGHRDLHGDRHAGHGRQRSSSTPATIRSARSAQPLPKPFIAVVVDEGNNRLGGVPVTFTVLEGGGSVRRPADARRSITDSDGRVAATLTLGPQEGNANNFVAGDLPVERRLRRPRSPPRAAHPAIPATTTISGVVLDNSNVPIPGVTVRAVLTNVLHSNDVAANEAPAVQTDAQGQFSLPAGARSAS